METIWASRIKEFFNQIPKGQDQIWWLIRHQEFWLVQELAPLGMWALCILVFRSIYDPVAVVIMAGTLVVHIYAHELAHASVLKRNGIVTKIWWLFPLGAVAGGITKEEDAKSFSLPQWTFALYALAGVIVNTLLIIAGLVLKTSSSHTVAIIGVGLILNGALSVILNLLPIWQVDGTFAFKAIIGSIGDTASIKLTRFFVFLAICVTLVVFAFNPPPIAGWLGYLQIAILNLGWIAPPVLLAVGVARQRKKHLESPLPGTKMDLWQASLQTILFLAIFYMSMLALTVT